MKWVYALSDDISTKNLLNYTFRLSCDICRKGQEHLVLMFYHVQVSRLSE